MDDLDKPVYEYIHELEGLRKQNDQLREINAQLRRENSRLESAAEDAVMRMRQMEEARAGVTGSRLFLQRIEPSPGAALYHYTINGTRSACSGRFDLSKYVMVELPTAPDGLCDRCSSLLQTEVRYNPYTVDDGPSMSEQQKRRARDRENEGFFKLTPDPNPAFATYVYMFQSEGENRFKVGISTEPRKRMATLRHAAGRVLRVIFLSVPCTNDGARSVEYAVKREFDRSRVAQEWYQLSWQQVKRVKEIITTEVARDRNKHATNGKRK